MKNILFILTILLAYTSSIAQREVAKKEDLEKFFKTKTMVVLEPNAMSAYNFAIEDAIKREWNITPYEFIQVPEYEKLRQDPQYSFITLDDVTFVKDKTKAKYTFICLSLGGKYKTTTDMPQLVTFPLSYRGIEEEYYSYKLGPIIHFMQSHVQLTNEVPTLKPINIISYYNKEAPSLKNKTLYLLEDDLTNDINTEIKFKKIYPYNFKFVAQEDLEDIIAKKQKDAVFFHKVGPTENDSKARVYKIFLGADDGKIYYFGYHTISDKKPDKLLDRDIRILTKEKEDDNEKE
jgi:hypothetical protein